MTTREESPNENVRDEHRLADLERQLERGSLFTHGAVSQTADRLHEVESFLYGLIDLLLDRGVIAPEALARAADGVRGEMAESGQAVGPGIALRIDAESDGQDEYVPVDCSARLHLCKAACCRLHFALTAEEVEAGKVKWDLGEPYTIRHDASGHCHHLDPEGRGCTVYADRPGVCRRYSCARDERLWLDFEKMILNEAWIEQNLGPSSPRLVSAQMLPQRLAFPQPRESESDT